MEEVVKSLSLHFEADKLPQEPSINVLLIEKAKEDVVSLVVPWYSSISIRLIYSSPDVVFLAITPQLFPTGHKNPVE